MCQVAYIEALRSNERMRYATGSYASLRLLLRRLANTNTHASSTEIPNLSATSSIVRSLSIRGTTSLSLVCAELIPSDLLLLLIARSSAGRSTPAPPASPTSAISSDVAPKVAEKPEGLNGLHSTFFTGGLPLFTSCRE